MSYPKYYCVTDTSSGEIQQFVVAVLHNPLECTNNNQKIIKDMKNALSDFLEKGRTTKKYIIEELPA